MSEQIPAEAVEAAARAIWRHAEHDIAGRIDRESCDRVARRAIRAALPYLVAEMREQVAQEVRGYSEDLAHVVCRLNPLHYEGDDGFLHKRPWDWLTSSPRRLPVADLTRLVEVLAAHRLVVNRSEQRPWCSCGWYGRPATDDHLAHQAEMLADAGLVVTAAHDAEVAEKALRDAANDWQMGGWAEDLPTGSSRVALILGGAQRATDWFRARADHLAAQEDE